MTQLFKKWSYHVWLQNSAKKTSFLTSTIIPTTCPSSMSTYQMTLFLFNQSELSYDTVVQKMVASNVNIFVVTKFNQENLSFDFIILTNDYIMMHN